MYETPEMKRFGTFHSLTQTGTKGLGDGCIVLDPGDGAVVDGNPDDGTFGDEFGLPRCGS
jgi:hypothetical protein